MAIVPVKEVPLETVRLTTQIGLKWPDDGHRHFYGPGEVKLPPDEVARLKKLPHRVVAR